MDIGRGGILSDFIEPIETIYTVIDGKQVNISKKDEALSCR